MKKIYLLILAFMAGVMYHTASAQNLIYSEDFEGDVSGLTIVGPGDATDGVFEDSGDSDHGIVFHNNPTSAVDVRTRYLQLPSTIFSDGQTAINTSQGLTISFWVNDNGVGVDADGFWWSSMFSAYGAAPSPTNGKPMFQLNTNKRLNVNFDDVMSDGNNYGWFDNIDWGTDNLEVVWLDNGGWRFYTIVLTPTSSNVYIDGVLSSSKAADTNNGTRIDGLFNVIGDLTYITIGGNSAWDWGDKDTPFSYDKIKIYDDVLTGAQITSLMNTDDIIAPVLTVNKSSLTLYDIALEGSFVVDASNLSEDITISAPVGITVNPTAISAASASDVTVIVTYDGTSTVDGDITISSSGLVETVAVTASVLPKKDPGTANLSHQWTFDVDATDRVGSVDGTLSATGATISGKALVLDGGFMEMDGATIAMNTYSEVTLEAWFTSTAGVNGGNTAFAYFGDSKNIGWDCGFDYVFMAPSNGGNCKASIVTGIDPSTANPWENETSVANPDGAIDDGQLHHLIAVIDAAGLTFYVDGISVGTSVHTGSNSISDVSTAFAFLGKSGYYGDPLWKGEIHKYSLYDKALAADEVAYLYTKGTEGDVPTTIEIAPLAKANVYASNGMINVKVDSPSNAVIYSLVGKIVKTELVEDIKSIPVSPGLYIVVVNGETKKVMVTK